MDSRADPRHLAAPTTTKGRTQVSRKIPSHEATYARMRDMVLFGALAPGQPVTIQGLCETLGAGMTPVREALRRLAAEGALAAKDNRRIAVPRLTLAEFDQIAFARLAIEPRLAALAALRLTPQTLARLATIDSALDAAIATADVPAYLRENHRFHFTLYEAAEAEVLTRLARMLWLRIAPSLRVVIAGAPGMPDRHRDALAALQSADAPRLQTAIHADIAEGMAHVRTALEAGEI